MDYIRKQLIIYTYNELYTGARNPLFRRLEGTLIQVELLVLMASLRQNKTLPNVHDSQMTILKL